MTRSERSAGVSSYVSRMFARLAARLACVSGTPLGFDVVPAHPETSTLFARGKVSVCALALHVRLHCRVLFREVHA